MECVNRLTGKKEEDGTIQHGRTKLEARIIIDGGCTLTILDSQDRRLSHKALRDNELHGNAFVGFTRKQRRDFQRLGQVHRF